MAIKPKVTEGDKLDLYRGSGKMGSEIDYLKSIDPITYYYNKFKSTNARFVRDDMWTEAALRGEANVYINLLSGIEKVSQTETIDSSFLDKYEFYENQGYGDYDTYMLALSLPTLNNTKKEQHIDELTGYDFGSYTAREWAEAVLTSTFQRYDAEIIEAEKASKNWWERMWIEIGTQTAGGLLNSVSGISNWVNDIYNIGQGLLNMCFNWSEDSSVGDRFLWAFANDEDDTNLSNQLSRFTEELTYRMNYEYSKTVNAVEAYEHNYIPPSWGEVWGTGWKTEGEKVYNGFGTMWNGITTSIGYMVPSILLATATGGASTAAWVPKTVGSVTMYTGVASGNIKDTVQRAALNGVSYRDLNAGSVVSNAVIKATAQWAVEVVLGKILGFFSISDKLRGLGDDTVSAATRIGATEGRAFLTAAGRGLKSMAKEGLEETLQDLSDGLIDSIYGIGGSKLDQIYNERGIETMDIENLVQTFIAGALTEGIVGSVHSVKFLGAKNRFIGENAKGETYKLGMFQSMNFAQSLAALNQWNDLLKNAEISKEEKAEAAYKISTVMNTIGEVLHSFGQLDAIKANNLLLAETELSAKEEAKLKLSDTEYAKNLYDTFIKSYGEVVSKYNKAAQDSQKEGLFEKVKKFFTKNAKELKDSKTTEVNNVITEKIDINSPDLTIDKNIAEKLKGILNDLGAVALIGVDGNIITKSDDIIAINNELLESGDIAEIVKGIAYQQVRDTVKTKLSSTQKKRILNTYRKLVGVEATLEEAVTALLFDKTFYTKVLLMTEERTRVDKLEAVKMLATIDNLIKTKSAELLKNGSLTDNAYKTLLKKVYETMRAGLIVYATQYARLDLGSISNDVLPVDIKQEISNHRNVIFSTRMDKGANGEALNDQDLVDFDNYVDKFNTQFSTDEIANLKRKARSTNSNDRRDAYRTLILAAKASSYKSVTDKITYVPASSDGVIEEENIRAFENFIGISFKSLIAGDYNANDLTHHAKNIICPGYDKGQAAYRYNMDDKDARINFAREVLFTISKSLTVGADGTILKLIEKDDFIKDEYLGKEGDTKFKQDLQKGKITKISDITKLTLPKALGNVKIIYDPHLGSINGHFDERINAIRANYTINTISMMHEVTHATQYYTQAGKDSTLGGEIEMFENLPQDILTDIDKYIADTMPMSYNFLSNNKHLKTPDIIYFLLEGELQANTTSTSHMVDIGFKWKNNKSELVSPDGKKSWPMKASKSKLLKAMQQEFKKQIKESSSVIAEDMRAKQKAKEQLDYDAEEGVWKPKKKSSKTDTGVSEDRILGTLEEAAVMQSPEITEFTKNAYLKKNGNPIIFYRGSTKGHELSSSSLGLFMSTKEYIGTDYAESRIAEKKTPSLKAYVTNFTKDEVLEIDNKGEVWNRVILDDNLKDLTQITNRPSISTDILVDQIFRLHPEIKAIWLRNVVEDPEERGKTGDDLIVNKKHTDGIKSIGIPDQNTFVYAWNRYYDLNKDSLGDFTSGKVKEDLYTKFSKLFKQAIDSNDFTKLEKALKTEPGAFDYMKKSVSEDRPLEPDNETIINADELKKEAQRQYHKDRYVNNERARKSNLKYWIKPGKSIFIHTGVRDFVENTTKDFDKLPSVIQKKIKQGSLTMNDIKVYVKTARNIDDYTFKAIAKYAFKNEELAKLNINDMYKLQGTITDLAAVSYISKDKNKVMTPTEMLNEYKTTTNEASDADLKRAFKYATTLMVSGKTDKNGPKAYISDQFPDTNQMNILFFEHYNGTLSSMRRINTLGKLLSYKQSPLELKEDVNTGELKGGSSGAWNWVDRSFSAEIDYDYGVVEAINLDSPDIQDSLNSISKVEKISSIAEYYQEVILDKVKKLTANMSKSEKEAWFANNYQNVLSSLEKKQDDLHDLDEDELNKRYLNSLKYFGETGKTIKGASAFLDTSKKEAKQSNRSILGNIYKNKTDITTFLVNNKEFYESLPDDIKLLFKPENNYELATKEYSSKSIEDLKALQTSLQEARKLLKVKDTEKKNLGETNKTLEKKIQRLERQNQKLKTELENQKRMKEEARDDKQTLREKLNSGIKYRTTIRQQEFNFTNNTEPTKLVNNLLNTSWTDTRMSTVQGVVSNKEEIIANGKKFFEENSVALLSSDLAEIEQTVDWFINARMNEATDTDYKKFVAVKGYFLAWVLGQTRAGEVFANMNSNLKQKIDSAIREMGSISGTFLAILNNMKEYINPVMAMASADIELDGVKIDGELKDKLFKAIESGKVEEMQKAQQAIFDYVASQRTNKKSFFRKIVTIRSMSMLSSPLTWLRNIISNKILRPMHKLTDKIGSKIFKSKTEAGQLKLNKQVTPEIQQFITQHFVDNKFFDTFINNLSKYNPSDIKDKHKTSTGLPTKEAIYTNLVLKSMYNQYYNDNMFNKDKKLGKFMNDIYHKLMKVMSDDKYVREAAIRYFGKLLAEHNADISSGQISDNIMNDLSTAIGLAMNDYMHSNNIFNDIEKAIMERGEGYWLLYKTILPFASSSWNWFKAAMRLTPLGLAKSIVDITRLEKRIAKAKSDWEAGKSQISPELTEFMIRRNLGEGVIGTVAFIFGALLSGLGFMSLEDDDYGVPKLRLGNVVIDVSSIFGTSSVLAGAVFANGIKEEGWGKDGWLTGLNNMVDIWLDDMPIMEIVEMDMYADGGFSMGLKNLESIALSYIPNCLSYFAGFHKGTIKKDTFWKRAIAKIPFLNWTLETKIDPYTGDEGSWADAIGRIVPFFSLDTASQNEKKSRQLGLNKKELNGTYKINGQDFNVSGKDLQEINKAYGLWNAEDLTKFYDNQLRVKVKVADNKYKELTYNQMTNEQRKNAVQTIMSNNAELAKIMAWTKAGNKYYGSATTYTTLRKRGIKTNVYKGTKGFVKSK